MNSDVLAVVESVVPLGTMAVVAYAMVMSLLIPLAMGLRAVVGLARHD